MQLIGVVAVVAVVAVVGVVSVVAVGGVFGAVGGVFGVVDVQSRDISIRHFQSGGVCLHFPRASFNTVLGNTNFKITLIFSEMTLHFNDIV